MRGSLKLLISLSCLLISVLGDEEPGEKDASKRSNKNFDASIISGFKLFHSITDQINK